MADLVGDVWTRITDVAAHLPHDTNMLVAVEKRVLVLLSDTAASAMRGLVRLKTGIGEDDDEALRVLVAMGNGLRLFCNKLGQIRRRKRLCPCKEIHGDG